MVPRGGGAGGRDQGKQRRKGRGLVREKGGQGRSVEGCGKVGSVGGVGSNAGASPVGPRTWALAMREYALARSCTIVIGSATHGAEGGRGVRRDTGRDRPRAAEAWHTSLDHCKPACRGDGYGMDGEPRPLERM